MKVKVLSAILIFSLALNLAVIGTFVYHQMNRPERDFPVDKHRPFFIRELQLTEDQRREMFMLFRKFRLSNREEMKAISEIEKQLFEEIKADSINQAAIDSLNNLIGERKLALSKRAIDNFIKTKKFLTAEQQDHFLNMLMQQRPAPFRHDRRSPDWAPGEERKQRPKDDLRLRPGKDRN